VGIAAYRAGHWAEALAELRAARRLTGRSSYLPMMADSERALGRLDRALDLVTGPQAEEADRATRIELKIVESGIRRDQGLPGAAVVALQIPELTDGRQRRGSARLYYAYADALLDAGRDDEAREWFARAAGADTQGETDADERFDELDQLAIEDLQAGGDEDLGLEDNAGDLDDELANDNLDDPDADDLDDDVDNELEDDDLEADDLGDEDAGDDGPGDEDGEARPGTADSTRDEPSPFEIHYLPPGDPAADDGDPETAGDPGPDGPGPSDAADGDDGGQLSG
jgi:tetratricopeptide (TPR) repeat protein